MKKSILLGLGAVAMACAAGAGLGANLSFAAEKPVETHADSAIRTFYINVENASWWSGDDCVIKLRSWNGETNNRFEGRWISDIVFAVENVDTTGWIGCEFIRANQEGEYLFSQWTEDFSKTYFMHQGSDNNGTWSNTNPYVSLTLTVTFTNAVNDYIDIYVPGAFNSWSEGAASKMTPTDGTRKTYTYSLNNVAIGSYKYKIVACYTIIGFDWKHQITPSEQTLEIGTGDASTTKNLGNFGYDFNENMPQKYAPVSAKITLTFASRVDDEINIYYAGDITKWANTRERLEGALMSPDATRTVFTFNIPENTPIGTYGYKIVAMSAHIDATAASYDYVVYDNNGGDAYIELTEESGTAALNANSTDLKFLGALAFAQRFLADTDEVCSVGEESDDHSTGLTSKWTGLKTSFEHLTDQGKTYFNEDADTTIADARARYIHIVERYDALAAFTGGPSAARIVSAYTQPNNNNAMMITVLAGAAAVATFAGVFFLRKRREN